MSPELTEFLKVVMEQLAGNIWVQGAFVTLVTSMLRKYFAELDKSAKDPEQRGKIQAIVAVLSIVVSLLNAYLTGQLSHFDPKALLDAVQVAIVALGIHTGGKDVKKALGKYDGAK